MTFNILLSVSIIVCLVGLSVRFFAWFSQGLKTSTSPVSTGGRIGAAFQGIFGALFSLRIFTLIKSFFIDLLLQKRIFDKSLLRWSAHSLIFFGFMLLLLMHALSPIVSEKIFADYQPTLNPFFFLRDMFGVMVLVGLGLAVYRRLSQKAQRLKTYPSDWTAITFVAVIILSGMLLGGAEISSYSIFESMVEDYTALDEEEVQALEAYWVEENGLISPHLSGTSSAELLAAGKEISADNCMDCHASNRSAFASMAAITVTRPFSAILGDQSSVSLFYYLHIIACLAFLAWLPFSKMFHILAAPASLFIKRISGDELKNPINSLNRQMVGLSACTHCGSCSVECSSSMFYEYFDNDFILPSEKVQYLKKFAAGKETNPAIVKRMQQGLYVCTSCDRCTTVCPSGINLKELFVTARYSLLEKGAPETTMLSHFSFPLALAQNFVGDHLKALKKVTDLFKKTFPGLSDLSTPLSLTSSKTITNTSFKGCYSCQRCTNICPVVKSYENPLETLGMLPHQIMYSLGIGNTELAMGSQMIWSCSTCYLCQEHCPNDVQLTDIFYSLKNGAINTIEAGANS